MFPARLIVKTSVADPFQGKVDPDPTLDPGYRHVFTTKKHPNRLISHVFMSCCVKKQQFPKFVETDFPIVPTKLYVAS